MRNDGTRWDKETRWRWGRKAMSNVKASRDELSLEELRSTMAKLRRCNGKAAVMQWQSCGDAMAELRRCNVQDAEMQWQSCGDAMAEMRRCNGKGCRGNIELRSGMRRGRPRIQPIMTLASEKLGFSPCRFDGRILIYAQQHHLHSSKQGSL